MYEHITALPDGTGIILAAFELFTAARHAQPSRNWSEMSGGVAVLSRIRPRPSPSLTSINTEMKYALFSIGFRSPAHTGGFGE